MTFVQIQTSRNIYFFVNTVEHALLGTNGKSWYVKIFLGMGINPKGGA